MPIEKSVLDRVINSGYLGKRKIGQYGLKHNIRTNGYQGWVELVFSPRNQVEKVVSETMKFIHPYLFFITYRFHVEKARDAGIRIEDVYQQKFHKEPYIMMHLYAQHFHPSTLLERVRDVRMYRQPRTLFKGFTVPDWATAEHKHGWEYDQYSRNAWENAMHNLHSEWTPMQFVGERQEPNVFQWLRLEQFGCGFSSRLFFNEVPMPTWYRQGGHLTATANDEKEKESLLHSFCHADQGRGMIFGMDTTTEEGREAFKREYEALAELAPELVKKEDLVFPHELPPKISDEPHYQRVWQHYREHSLKVALCRSIEKGDISQEDADAASAFLGMTSKAHGVPSMTVYILARTGKLAAYENEPGYKATMSVMNALGLGDIEFNHHSAQPVSEQFWDCFDGVFELTPDGMSEELDVFITDPNNRTAVDALLESRTEAAPKLE